MTLGRHIGTARDYEQLHALLRARVDELGVTYEGVDAVAGLPSRYTAKLLSPVPMKAIGKTSMGPLLGALGLKLIVAVDDETLARIIGRLAKRARKQSNASADMLPLKRKKRRGVWRGDKDWSRIMNSRRALNVPESKRKKIAQTAARARWRGHRPVQDAKAGPAAC